MTTDTRTMRERMLAGDLYIADDPDLEEASYVARERMAAYNAAPDRDKERQARAARRAARRGRARTRSSAARCTSTTAATSPSAPGRFANYGLVALDVAPITIGDDVQIGPNVQLLTPTHPVEPEPRREKWESAEPITIGDNVWLGGGAIVCPGVTIGENTVVGAGAVVTKDLPGERGRRRQPGPGDPDDLEPELHLARRHVGRRQRDADVRAQRQLGGRRRPAPRRRGP